MPATQSGRQELTGKSAAVGSLRLPALPLLALLLLALLRAAAVAGTHDGAATNSKTTALR
eukprot:COSAG04_NODE_409_length_14823_cov_4.646767_12_plen_60_part_00